MPRRECMSTGIQLRDLGDKGLGAVADQALDIGTVVLQERPYATSLLPSSTPEVCRACFSSISAPTKGLQTCRSCRAVHYCSYRCASGDRQAHRVCGECWLFAHWPVLSAVLPEELQREAVLALRHLAAPAAAAATRSAPSAATGPPPPTASAEPPSSPPPLPPPPRTAPSCHQAPTQLPAAAQSQPQLSPAALAPLRFQMAHLAPSGALESQLAAWQTAHLTAPLRCGWGGAGPGAEGVEEVVGERLVEAVEVQAAVVGAAAGVGPRLAVVAAVLARAVRAGLSAQSAHHRALQRRLVRRDQREEQRRLQEQRKLQEQQQQQGAEQNGHPTQLPLTGTRLPAHIPSGSSSSASSSSPSACSASSAPSGEEDPDEGCSCVMGGANWAAWWAQRRRERRERRQGPREGYVGEVGPTVRAAAQSVPAAAAAWLVLQALQVPRRLTPQLPTANGAPNGAPNVADNGSGFCAAGADQHWNRDRDAAAAAAAARSELAAAVAAAARALSVVLMNALEVALHPAFTAGLIGAGRAPAPHGAPQHTGQAAGAGAAGGGAGGGAGGAGGGAAGGAAGGGAGAPRTAGQEGTMPLALYRYGCRLNHSCRPSAAAHFRPGGQLMVRLVGDLTPGGEVTLSYVDVALPRHRRWRQLHDKYGFDCGCERCRDCGPGWDGDGHGYGISSSSNSPVTADGMLSARPPCGRRKPQIQQSQLVVKDGDGGGGDGGGGTVAEVEGEGELNAWGGAEQRLQSLVLACGDRLLRCDPGSVTGRDDGGGIGGGDDADGCSTAADAYTAFTAGLDGLLVRGQEAQAAAEAGASEATDAAGPLIIAPQHSSCMDAYVLLASAARRCARERMAEAEAAGAGRSVGAGRDAEAAAAAAQLKGNVDMAVEGGGEAAAGVDLVGAAGLAAVAWWCRAVCASLTGAAAAERLLAAEPGLLPHTAAAWSGAASTACELLAALCVFAPVANTVTSTTATYAGTELSTGAGGAGDRAAPTTAPRVPSTTAPLRTPGGGIREAAESALECERRALPPKKAAARGRQQRQIEEEWEQKQKQEREREEKEWQQREREWERGSQAVAANGQSAEWERGREREARDELQRRSDRPNGEARCRDDEGRGRDDDDDGGHDSRGHRDWRDEGPRDRANRDRDYGDRERDRQGGRECRGQERDRGSDRRRIGDSDQQDRGRWRSSRERCSGGADRRIGEDSDRRRNGSPDRRRDSGRGRSPDHPFDRTRGHSRDHCREDRHCGCCSAEDRDRDIRGSRRGRDRGASRDRGHDATLAPHSSRRMEGGTRGDSRRRQTDGEGSSGPERRSPQQQQHQQHQQQQVSGIVGRRQVAEGHTEGRKRRRGDEAGCDLTSIEPLGAAGAVATAAAAQRAPVGELLPRGRTLTAPAGMVEPCLRLFRSCERFAAAAAGAAAGQSAKPGMSSSRVDGGGDSSSGWQQPLSSGGVPELAHQAMREWAGVAAATAAATLTATAAHPPGVAAELAESGPGNHESGRDDGGGCGGGERRQAAPLPPPRMLLEDLAAAAAACVAHSMARLQLLLRVLLGEAHGSCEAAQFLPYFVTVGGRHLPYDVAGELAAAAMSLLERVHLPHVPLGW